jgi:hypothetical protein
MKVTWLSNEASITLPMFRRYVCTQERQEDALAVFPRVLVITSDKFTQVDREISDGGHWHMVGAQCR